MRDEVIARHLGSHEERPAFIDYESSKLFDKNGNELDYRFWTYDYKQKLDVSPSFAFVFAVLSIGLIYAAYQIFTGGLK